jgi:anthranilate synthase/aminodeoxychorismate synthase-like glutamine amidotransferase
VILVIDNYDSFTYNLVQYLGVLGERPEVRRNDRVTVDEIGGMAPDGIMLSPGPCTPERSGVCLDILRLALSGSEGRKDRKDSWIGFTPIFGVCLGHQAMSLVAGGIVRQARNIMHGKASQIEHDGKGLFEGMPNPFSAIRYHSLVVERGAVPPGFQVTASAMDDGEIMGLRHESLPIEGVQFHPESALTQGGIRIVENFVRRVDRARSAATR